MNTRTRLLVDGVAAVAAALALVACEKPTDPLSVVPPAASAPAVATGAPVQVTDIDVTENVKTALLRSEVLQGVDISVVTLKGDVRLTGALDSQAQIDEALRIARASDGAHSIHDELTLRSN
jgi:uncharacterized lipoprotein YajG